MTISMIAFVHNAGATQKYKHLCLLEVESLLRVISMASRSDSTSVILLVSPVTITIIVACNCKQSTQLSSHVTKQFPLYYTILNISTSTIEMYIVHFM